MPTRNVNLTDHFEKFITRLVAAGEYSNASEVVRDGLRLVEERKKAQRARLQSLRSAAKEGIDDIERGDFVEFDSDAAIDSFLGKLENQVVAGRRRRAG
jgi:antitoxin ParD1/3/4